MYGSVNDSCPLLLLAKEASLLAKEKALEQVREKDFLQQRAVLWATSIADVLEPIGHSVVSVHAEPGDLTACLEGIITQQYSRISTTSLLCLWLEA